MNEFIEILKYTVPALVVLLTSYLILKRFLDFNNKHLVIMQQNIELEKQKIDTDSKRKREDTFIPLKLQAYERMALFMERINPPNLITRELKPGLNAGQFHSLLLTSVKDEFEHNMSQQIYLSDEAWSFIKHAKESVLSLINRSAQQVDKNEKAVKLAETILSHSFEEGKNPVDMALAALKKDIRNQFS